MPTSSTCEMKIWKDDDVWRWRVRVVVPQLTSRSFASGRATSRKTAADAVRAAIERRERELAASWKKVR